MRGGLGQDVEAKECQACVSSALQGVVLLDAFPKASVDLHVLVVEAQGGARHTDQVTWRMQMVGGHRTDAPIYNIAVARRGGDFARIKSWGWV